MGAHMQAAFTVPVQGTDYSHSEIVLWNRGLKNFRSEFGCTFTALLALDRIATIRSNNGGGSPAPISVS